MTIDRTELIQAATAWPTNAELVEAAAYLYLDYDAPSNPDYLVLDPTYGKGTWWNEWRPAGLVAHDLAIDGVNFLDLPYPDGHFHAAVFDPEYAPAGGAETSSIQTIQTDYGRGAAAKVPGSESPQECQDTMHRGLASVARTVRAGGIILAKSQAYIWNTKWWDGTRKMENFATLANLEVLYRFEHLGRKPQPKRGVCMNCGAKLQRLADGTWAAMARRLPDAATREEAVAELRRRNLTCPDPPIVEEGEDTAPIHQPDPTAKIQRNPHRNVSSLTVFQVADPPPPVLFDE